MNRDGSWSCTERFAANYDYCILNAPQPFSTLHPFIPWLVCDHFEIEEEVVFPNGPSGLPIGPAIMSVAYCGINGNSTRPVVSFYNETSQQAIETHQRVISQIAGTPAAPLNGAIFDPDTSEFKGFGIATIWPTDFVTQSKYAGVTGYEAPQPMKSMVWATKDPRCRMYAQSVWQGGSVGGITADGCLLIKFDIDQEGGCYRIRQTWMQPGPRFINDGILYPKDRLGCPTDINSWAL